MREEKVVTADIYDTELRNMLTKSVTCNELWRLASKREEVHYSGCIGLAGATISMRAYRYLPNLTAAAIAHTRGASFMRCRHDKNPWSRAGANFP